METDWQKWIDVAAPDLIVASVVGLISVSVGSALTLFWSLKQKERELDLATAREFHNHYGSFFSTWKVWNQYLKISNDLDPVVVRGIFDRAASAEGGMEAILSRLAAHRRLSREMVHDLACFRQAFQSLRQAIRAEQELAWWSSEVDEYKRFKHLSSRVSKIILGRPIVWPFCAVSPARAWEEMTSNKWEEVWLGVPSH